jgi:hypothetical protein
VSAPGAPSAGSIITACDCDCLCELSFAVGAGVDAADAEADPLGLGLVASIAETNPLESMIAVMTAARASNLANRGVFDMV